MAADGRNFGEMPNMPPNFISPTILFLFAIGISGLSPIVAKAQLADSNYNKVVDHFQRVEARLNAIDSNNRKPNATANLGKPLNAGIPRQIEWFDKTLVAAPILLFILAGLYLNVRLRREGFTLADALSTFRPDSKKTTSRVLSAGIVQSANEAETTSDIPVKSSSRLIAMLTGMVSLIIAICLTSYAGYRAIIGSEQTVDIDGLWKVLAALGIGVVPYGINVFNGNSKEGSDKPAKSS